MMSMEEKELIIRAKAKDMDAIEELIKRNKGMIFMFANSLSTICESLDIDDLYQEGVIEIINAINKYDLNSGVKFSTYIYKCIRGKMLNVIQKYDRMIKYPKTVIEKITKINRKIDESNRNLGKDVSFDEIILNTDISSDELTKYIKLKRKIIRIEDMKTSYLSQYDNEICLDIEFELASKEDFEQIAINNVLADTVFSSYYLTDVEKKILYLLYYEQMSMRETAKTLGYSPRGVKVIQERSLKKIRKNIIKM